LVHVGFSAAFLGTAAAGERDEDMRAVIKKSVLGVLAHTDRVKQDMPQRSRQLLAHGRDDLDAVQSESGTL
jgi:hypothetical protein